MEGVYPVQPWVSTFMHKDICMCNLIFMPTHMQMTPHPILTQTEKGKKIVYLRKLVLCRVCHTDTQGAEEHPSVPFTLLTSSLGNRSPVEVFTFRKSFCDPNQPDIVWHFSGNAGTDKNYFTSQARGVHMYDIL